MSFSSSFYDPYLVSGLTVYDMMIHLLSLTPFLLWNKTEDGSYIRLVSKGYLKLEKCSVRIQGYVS